jgi:hypothetical protein
MTTGKKSPPVRGDLGFRWGVVLRSYDGRMPSQRCIKTICIVCAAMDTVVQQGRLHFAVAGVRARMAALERFVGCADGGAGGEMQLRVLPSRCSDVLRRSYGDDGLETTYLRVYPEFAVLFVGSIRTMYKSDRVFQHAVGAFYVLTGWAPSKQSRVSLVDIKNIEKNPLQKSNGREIDDAPQHGRSRGLWAHRGADAEACTI